MANPYKYTKAEINALVDEWHEGHIKWSLKEFIMWETKFSSDDYERWATQGVVPPCPR